MASRTVRTSTSIHDNKEFYRKKIQNKKLSGCLEYTAVNVSWQASLGISALLFLSSYDFREKAFNMWLIAAAGVYLICALLSYLIASRIRAGILSEQGDVSVAVRMLGLVMIPFVFVGNIFMCIAGFMLLRRDKQIEYQLAVYSLMTLLGSFLVSSINLMKPWVAQYYYIGMGLLLIGMIFNILLMIAASRWVHGRRVDTKILPLAALSLLQIAYGNVFGLLFGLIIISKARHKDQAASVEWVDIMRRLFRNYMAVIGMFVVVFLISLSTISALTFDYNIAVSNDYANILRAPCAQFPFGTDNYGRCVFTRIVFGARISLVVGIVATLLPILVGGSLGAIAGYYGKSTENAIMRTLDILYAVPEMLLAVAIVAAFGANTVNLILALSVSSIPVYARTVRATVLSLSKQEFVEAAKACGAKNRLIIFRHIIPNSLAPVIVRATIGIGAAVLSTSALSYLGLGVEPHIPEWGNILKAGSSYLETNPYIAIFPGLAIIIIVLAFNFFGDGLRDALDPKLK